MRIQRITGSRAGGLLLVLAWLLSVPVQGATVVENFATDPGSRGWNRFGETNLFAWDSSQAALRATWDSSKSNSYCYLPLGMALNEADDFEMSFDLRIDSIQAGVTPGKPYAFELAVGLLNLSNATQATFVRGTASASPNLVEFDYFPDTGFGATISPLIVSGTGQFIPSFNFPLEMDPGAWFTVTLRYTATHRVLSTTMTREGVAFGPIQDVTLKTGFTGFRVDAFSISSFSDAGQAAGFSGSILAEGLVDNVRLVLPEPGIRDFHLIRIANGYRLTFAANSGWRYVVERTVNFTTWETLGDALASEEGVFLFEDTSSAEPSGFYRIRAVKP